MDTIKAMKKRHSVRQFEPRPIPPGIIKILQRKIDAVNAHTGLLLQLLTDEPKAFGTGLARYGVFKGVRNYIALVGPKSWHLDEELGYYGEQLVLLAQSLGLNSCWVGLTYSKRNAEFHLPPGCEIKGVIALGYGKTQGSPHKNRKPEDIAPDYHNAPLWFQKGVDAALLAPTAINQQKFHLYLDGGTVDLVPGTGPYVMLDLGIVRYHFEEGAGRDNFHWKK